MKEKNKWDDVIELVNDTRDINLGKYYSYNFEHDIKHLGFIFARYKFVSKMMEYRSSIKVLELGCSYGIGSQFFKQTKSCKYYCGVDLDHDAIEYAKETFGSNDTLFVESDFMNNIYDSNQNGREYDAVISLDVIEHIEEEREQEFVNTIKMNLKEDGFVVIGTPNITMNPYASEGSKRGHINLYDQKRLYSLLDKNFKNVFMFGMNDEVLHTGFAPMSCYIFALCTMKV